MSVKVISFLFLILAAASKAPHHGEDKKAVVRTPARIEIDLTDLDDASRESDSVSEVLPPLSHILAMRDMYLATVVELPKPTKATVPPTITVVAPPPTATVPPTITVVAPPPTATKNPLRSKTTFIDLLALGDEKPQPLIEFLASKEPQPLSELLSSDDKESQSVIELLSSDDEESQSTANTSRSIVLTLPSTLVGPDQLSYADYDAAASHFLSQLENSTSKVVDLPLLQDELPSSGRQIGAIKFCDLLKSGCVNDQIISAYFKQLPFFGENEYYSMVDPLSIQVMPERFEFEWGRVYLWPLHHLEEFHWTLLVVDLRNEKMVLQHYDSLTTEKRRSGLNTAAAILKKKLGITKKFSYEKKPTPQQTNGVDCGIFVSEIAKRLVLGNLIDPNDEWDGEMMRKTMAVELVTTNLYSY